MSNTWTDVNALPQTVIDRFKAGVQRVDADGCWTWTGSHLSRGYGRIRCGTRQYLVHRVSYSLANGGIPDGLVVDHLCRNVGCCNPSHLEAVTQGENVRRGAGVYEFDDRCRRGHDVTLSENVYVTPKGRRKCRPCARINDLARSPRRRSSATEDVAA